MIRMASMTSCHVETISQRFLRKRKAVTLKPKKKTSLTPAERAASFRASLKKHPELWEEYKKKERERKRRERLTRTEEQKQTDREKSRERQCRYKQRLQEKGLKPRQIVKVLTRSEREKARAYWREKQAECRARKSSQKKRRIKEYDREYRRDIRTKSVSGIRSKSVSEIKTPDQQNCSTFSKEALRKAASRVKNKMPKSAEKFAESLRYIIDRSSPGKKAALKRHGLLYSPRKMMENQCREKVVEHLKEQMQQKKTLKRQYMWSMKVMKKYKLSRTTALLFNVGPSDIARCKDPDADRKKRSDALSPDAKRKLDFFFNKPSVSTTLPDKKAVRAEKAKKVLDRPLTDVYKDFQKEHPEVKVGFSTFAENRPSNIETTKKQPWYSCLCEVCTNLDLKLRSLNYFATKVGKPDTKIKDKYEAVNITLCNKNDNTFHRLQCVNRECEYCRTDLLMAHLQPLVEEHGEDLIEYTRWDPVRTHNRNGKSVSKVMMVKHRKKLVDFIVELMAELETLAKHLFNAKWQQNQFSSLIKDIPQNWVVLNLDFSENYSCVSQMEIQTAHWHHQQVTIHPVVTYYNCDQCQETVQEDLIFISEDLTHDAHAVQKFISLTNTHLTENRGLEIQHEVQYSDGCASQYKSFTPFCDISYAKEDFGFPIERHFYGSRHGKGPSDGAGAVVKSAARRAVKGQECVINNSVDLYEFSKKKLSKDNRPGTNDHLHFKRTVFHVTESDINRNRPDRVAKTVKGTRSLHCIKTDSCMNILTRKLSCFCIACRNGHGQCDNVNYVEDWHDEHLFRQGERRTARQPAQLMERGRGGVRRRQERGGIQREQRRGRGGRGQGRGGVNKRQGIGIVHKGQERCEVRRGGVPRGQGRGGSHKRKRADRSSSSAESDLSSQDHDSDSETYTEGVGSRVRLSNFSGLDLSLHDHDTNSDTDTDEIPTRVRTRGGVIRTRGALRTRGGKAAIQPDGCTSKPVSELALSEINATHNTDLVPVEFNFEERSILDNSFDCYGEDSFQDIDFTAILDVINVSICEDTAYPEKQSTSDQTNQSAKMGTFPTPIDGNNPLKRITKPHPACITTPCDAISPPQSLYTEQLPNNTETLPDSYTIGGARSPNTEQPVNNETLSTPSDATSEAQFPDTEQQPANTRNLSTPFDETCEAQCPDTEQQPANTLTLPATTDAIVKACSPDTEQQSANTVTLSTPYDATAEAQSPDTEQQQAIDETPLTTTDTTIEVQSSKSQQQPTNTETLSSTDDATSEAQSLDTEQPVRLMNGLGLGILQSRRRCGLLTTPSTRFFRLILLGNWMSRICVLPALVCITNF